MSEINFFAKTNFRNQEQIFGIKRDDRRRHTYIIGKTGMGKSSLLENMAIQDIKNGEGVCVVDPHGEFAEKMVRAIPENRINDVVYFNPADLEFPIAFNILESVDEDKKNLVASGMMGVFKKIWPDVWSPRMEYILNNTILALLDYPGSTMLGVNRMMSDKDFRKRVYPKIKDPVVKSFWINEFDKWEDRFRKEAVAAIQNKVGQFLSSPVIRHIIGQPKSTIDMREIMDNKKILIVNLSKGKIGEDAMHLLGGMVITKIQLAAMGRVDIPEEKRDDFYLYVDEFQNFATESFANILSEARKYRLNLILAHQYINQLIFDGNATVKDAIFGNIGTIISFRVGADDAEYLEREFEPVFIASDIVNLSKYQVYLKLMIDGIAGDAFSAATLPPIDVTELDGNTQKVIEASRGRYGGVRKEIEEKIARWSGMFDFDEIEKMKKKNIINQKSRLINKNNLSEKREDFNINQTKKNLNQTVKNNLFLSEAEIKLKNKLLSENQQSTENKELYNAVCGTCGEEIKVPFKPDPQRPTFCRECLKDYQRAKARDENERKEKEKVQNKDYQKNKNNSLKKKYSQAESSRPVAFISREKPISLNQVSHIGPKKFGSRRNKVGVNLKEVKKLMDKAQNNKDE